MCLACLCVLACRAAQTLPFFCHFFCLFASNVVGTRRLETFFCFMVCQSRPLMSFKCEEHCEPPPGSNQNQQQHKYSAKLEASRIPRARSERLPINQMKLAQSKYNQALFDCTYDSFLEFFSPRPPPRQ